MKIKIDCEHTEKLTLLKDLPCCKAGAVVYCYCRGDGVAYRTVKPSDADNFIPFFTDKKADDSSVFREIFNARETPGWVKVEIDPDSIIHLGCPKCGGLTAIPHSYQTKKYDDDLDFYYTHVCLTCLTCGHDREIYSAYTHSKWA